MRIINLNFDFKINKNNARRGSDQSIIHQGPKQEMGYILQKEKRTYPKDHRNEPTMQHATDHELLRY